MATHSQSPSSCNAFSFISKGWCEVRDSANADLRLMRDRANSFKKLATSFDRDYLNSPSPPPFYLPSALSRRPPLPSDIDFVKNLQPRLLDARRRGGFGKKVMEKWQLPRPRFRIQ